MALEAIQALAGQRCIESTRIYLHLTNAWLAGQYTTAMSAIDGDLYRTDPPAEDAATGLAPIVDLPEPR